MTEEYLGLVLADGIGAIIKPETLSPMDIKATGARRARAIEDAIEGKLPQEVLIDELLYLGDDVEGARVIIPFRLHYPTKEEMASVAVHFSGFLRWFSHNENLMPRDASNRGSLQFLVGEKDRSPLYTLLGGPNSIKIHPHGRTKGFDGNLFEYPVYAKNI